MANRIRKCGVQLMKGETCRRPVLNPDHRFCKGHQPGYEEKLAQWGK